MREERAGDAVRHVGVIVAAAGSGERLGAGIPKALVELGGRPMLAYSLLTAAACRHVAIVVVAGPPDHLPEIRGAVRALSVEIPISVVGGGATRQESVRLALTAVPSAIPILVCHDAARPFASMALFSRVIDEVSKGSDGAVPVLRPADTVKRLEGQVVAGTIPRQSVGLAQTPQGFAAASLRLAHARAEQNGAEATDDSMLLESAGIPVVAVPGEPSNLKVTTPEDLEWAERALSRSAADGPAHV